MLVKRLLIGSIVKNNINFIQNVLKNIEGYIDICKNHFNIKEHYTFFADGNSTDGTYEVIKDWCDKDPIRRKVKKQLNTDFIRPLSLQQARNMYIEHFEGYFEEGTYLLILDTDDVNAKPLSEESFLSNFKYNSENGVEWDFMGANQTKDYYDIWTLRSEECNYDCWKKYRETGDINYVNKHHKHIPTNSPLIEVQSAFGGTGIYHTKNLKGLRYSAFTNEGIEQCEHVELNLQLHKRGGKLYINPAFINV